MGIADGVRMPSKLRVQGWAPDAETCNVHCQCGCIWRARVALEKEGREYVRHVSSACPNCKTLGGVICTSGLNPRDG